MKVAASLVAMLMMFSLGLNCSAQAQRPTEPLTDRQREILRIVRSVDGYIDQAIHDEFWNLFPEFARNDPRFPKLLGDLLGKTGDARQEFQRQTWMSARESLAARRVIRTPGYTAAIQALRNATTNSGFQDGIQKSFASAERLLNASATGQPLTMPDGPTFITKDVIDRVLTGMDASEFRGKKLVQPSWDETLVRFDYPAARVSVLAVTPYTLEWKDIATPEIGNIKAAILSQRRGPVAWAGISYLQTGSRYRDPVRSLISTARAAIDGSGALGRPPIFSTWRGMNSATAAGTARTSEGTVYAAVRAVEVPEISGVLQFVVVSEMSLADAINERAKLEDTTQIVP